MKPLILSFFVVIFFYSLVSNTEEEVKQEDIPAIHEKSVYFDQQPGLQSVDSVPIYQNEIPIV